MFAWGKAYEKTLHRIFIQKKAKKGFFLYIRILNFQEKNSTEK